MKKSFVRLRMLDERKKLNDKGVSEKSESIVSRLLESGLLSKPKNILVYLPINKEVDCTILTEELRRLGKNLFLPSYDKNNWIICKFLSQDELTVKIFGVKQPKVLRKVKPDMLDAVVLPGLAFSKSGGRVGFGYGVYDKLLKDLESLKIGLCFDFQVLDDFDLDLHDVKVNYIVSETGLIRIT